MARLTAPDTSAAQAAEFNRAKDIAGQVAGGALTGLRSSLGARGQLGGGLEASQTGRIATEGQRGLGEFVREQAIQGSRSADDFAKVGYQGDITQRAQDLANQQAANQVALGARGQDISAALRGRELDLAESSNYYDRQRIQQQQLADILGSLGLQLY
jgi:hypothetical protein